MKKNTSERLNGGADESAYQHILEHYHGLIDRYGFEDAHVLNYANYDTQVSRFVVLNQIAHLNGCRILDLGCGLGDLSYLLRKQTTTMEYLGMDINERMLERAREKYPKENFVQGNIFEFSGFQPDYILASGLFGLSLGTLDRSLEFFQKTVEVMFHRAAKGVAFNVLNSRTHPFAPTEFFTLSVPELYEFALTLTGSLSIRQDYLEHDVTLYLYK